MNNNDIPAFMTAIGALAEMSVQFYRAAVRSGATSEEAIDLTRELMRITLTQNMDGGNEK